MKKKILVVDDDEQDRKIMKRFFNSAGFERVFFAENGEECLGAVKDTDPHLVIIDTLLPGMDGFEVCRRIRELCGTTTPRIIVVTGSVDAIDAVKARQAGADDYCVKNVDCSYLIDAVRRFI